MANKNRNYYVDWWKIKKGTVVGVGVFLLLISLLGLGVWWLMRNNWILNNIENSAGPKDAARISSFEGDVRVIRASTRVTEKVTKDTFLSAGDTIQTQADGKAQIRMIDGSTLTVRPNSTVVIRNSDSIFGGTNVRVALDDGQINVRTEDQNETSNNIVEVKETENKLQSQTDASFGVNPTTSGGEIRISRGGVETNAGGEKTIINNGEFASIKNGKIASRERLHDPPRLVSPASLVQFLTTGKGSVDVTFNWQKSESGGDFSYRLEIATSPFFVPDGMILQRDPLRTTSFTMGNFNPGVYYWRLRGTSNTGQTTEWSEPWRFTVVKREGNESLPASDWKVESLGGKLYLISGKTVSGAIVRIAGRETFAAGDGSFRLQVSAPSNEITAEVGDENGNRNRYVLSLPEGKLIRQY